MDKIIYIYTLSHPKTNEIRYVGKTHNLKKRLWQSIYDKSKTKKNNWIKSITNTGLIPVMEVIEETNTGGWPSAEKYWIAQLKEWGFRLLNATDGGEGISGAKLNLTDMDRKSRAGRSKKEVIQCDLNGNEICRFSSATDACSKYGNAINRALIGKRKKAYGYVWKYVKVYKSKNTTITQSERKNRSERLKNICNQNKRPVVVFDKKGVTIGFFNSISDAAEEYSILNSAIANQLNGRSQSCNNKIFRYV